MNKEPTTIPKIRKIFSVFIGKKEYDVYSIEGKEHQGFNDIPKEWWLYYTDRLPGEAIPPIDSESFVPFSVSINRRLWDIKIKQYNTSKVKWGESQFSTGTNVQMWCNNKLVYSFGTFDLAFAMAKIQYLQVVLSEHVYNFFDTEKENGRKICWYGLPATIRVSSNTWEISIIPDYSANGFNKESWWKELDRRESKFSKPDKEWDDIDKEYRDEAYRSDSIRWGDALSDDHIYWFRK